MLIMQRLFSLVVLTGLLLALGCGKEGKTISPSSVPPPPKEPPKGNTGPGGNPGSSAPALTP